jgi:branched-chain amino acid transport system substrate-binding protein
MRLSRRQALAAGLATATAAAPCLGRAQPARSIKVGFLTDMSGPYKDITGPTGAICAQQAVADFGAAEKGIRVEFLVADHQHKPDVGVGIVREWLDRQDVDVIMDVGNSSIAFAVNDIVVQRNKVHLNTGGASSELTGRNCNANTIHWPYDTWMLANSTGKAVVRAGGDKWFVLAANYTFGVTLKEEITAVVEGAGGRITGSAAHPFPGTTDFSSFLLRAQSSGCNVIGLANAGVDLLNCVKQGAEFGLARRGIRMAALVAFIQDVHALGLEVAQGLNLTESFYWDMNDQTRAFTSRVRPRLPGGNYPNMDHASAYSAMLHYLKVVQAMGVDAAKGDGRAAVEAMKRLPTEDDCFGRGEIRADGRKIHPAYLFEVKKPQESRGPWDYYKLAATTPAENAFRPLLQGHCRLVQG